MASSVGVVFSSLLAKSVVSLAFSLFIATAATARTSINSSSPSLSPASTKDASGVASPADPICIVNARSAEASYNLNEAIRWTRRCLRTTESRKKYTHYLIGLLRNSNQLSAAVYELKSYLQQVSPLDLTARIRLIELYFDLDDFTLAREELNFAKNYFVHESVLKDLESRIFNREAEIREFIQSEVIKFQKFESANLVNFQTNSEKQVLEKIKGLLEKRNLAEIESVAKVWWEKFPEKAWAASIYARRLMDRKDYALAESVLVRHLSAVKKSNTDLQARLLYAEVLFKQGKHQEALKYYTELEKTYPASSEVKLSFAKYLLLLGAREKAMSRIQRIPSSDPEFNKAKVISGKIQKEGSSEY